LPARAISVSEVIGLDREQRKVLCAHRPPLAYDRLSINIGSMPAVARVPRAPPSTPFRSSRFAVSTSAGWLCWSACASTPGRTTIAVVGAGAAGVELTLAMQYRLRKELRLLGRDPDELRFHLFSAAREILPTHNARVRRAFEQVLVERGSRACDAEGQRRRQRAVAHRARRDAGG
jgi:selenide,water dikinase